MAHDFAKQHANSQKKASRASNKRGVKKEQNNSSPWKWFFSGVFIGLFIALLGFLSLTKFQTVTTPAEQISNNQDPDLAPQEEASDPVLSFYDYLAETEVQVDVVQVAVVEDEESSEELILTNYLLQAGSFQTKQDAENRLAKVILLNMDASIAPGIVSGKTWHRVRVGPFAGRASAEDARGILSSNNIDTIVMRVP